MKACTLYERYNLLRAFSHDVTAAILVFSKTIERRPCWCTKKILWELYSFVMQTFSFFSISIDAGHVSENATWVNTLIWRKHCSIDQSCCSMTLKRFLENSSGMKFFQPSVRLLFLFRSRVFISRSHEYCSIMFNNRWNQQYWPPTFF